MLAHTHTRKSQQSKGSNVGFEALKRVKVSYVHYAHHALVLLDFSMAYQTSSNGHVHM